MLYLVAALLVLVFDLAVAWSTGEHLPSLAWGILLAVALYAANRFVRARAMTVVVRNGRVCLYEDDALRHVVFDAPYNAFDELVICPAKHEEDHEFTTAHLHALGYHDPLIDGHELRLITDMPRADLTEDERQCLETVAREIGVRFETARKPTAWSDAFWLRCGACGHRYRALNDLDRPPFCLGCHADGSYEQEGE